VQTARLSPEVHSYIHRFLLTIFLRVSTYLVIYTLPTPRKGKEYKILYAGMERETCIRNMYFEVVALLYIVSRVRNEKALRMTLLLRNCRGLFLKLRVQDLSALAICDT
jgi:hypothetical protein